jgi:ubiquinone/menaquinone biosynthesis C-methylase UbiE
VDILDVGCGTSKVVGAVGLDLNPATAADIVHDLNVYPWPLADSIFDRIVCSHIAEHVTDMVRFVEEVHRVGRPGAQIEIVTPHFSNRFSYTDPTHVRHLSLFSFDFFVEQAPLQTSLVNRVFETQPPLAEFYSAVRFRKVHSHLSFARPFRLIGIQWFANRCPYLYEAYWAFILPARDVYLTLKVLK